MKILACLLAFTLPLAALPPALEGRVVKGELSTFVIAPERIVWTSSEGVKNADHLLLPKPGQAMLTEQVAPLRSRAGCRTCHRLRRPTHRLSRTLHAHDGKQGHAIGPDPFR